MKSFDIASLTRKNIRNLKPYSSARDDFKGTAAVYLDANENPNNTAFNRYPDPHQAALKKRIGELKQLAEDQIFLGNGSDEAIDLLFRAFCEPGADNVIIPAPTYGMYAVSAGINDVAVVQVPLTETFDIDPELIEKSWNDHTRIIFLCSPNNPSGNLLSRHNIEILLNRFHGIVVVDEAYIDFTGQQGFVQSLDRYQNLVVLQTLSKAWGLAGIRLGMCFASPEIIGVLNKIKPPYNISTLTQDAALVNLQEEKQKTDWVLQITRQRSLLKDALEAIEPVQIVYPSDANFLLVKIVGARQIYDALVVKGIIVRDRSSVILCADCLRITVGTAAENSKLIAALKSL